jgi:hypothetical protein
MPVPHTSQSPRRVPPHFPCPQCHDVMLLSVVQPEPEPGQERHTFECRNCGHSESLTSSIGR